MKLLVQKMTIAENQQEFDEILSKIEKKGSKKLLTYLKENWLDIEPARRRFQKNVNHGNTTTNRVESHNAVPELGTFKSLMGSCIYMISHERL